ncbi:MAG TPA: radical SAM protein, partial [Candidatus Nitrosotenuis sp.]|nr:radical SAM protein [Candidatus Nitrosotenuis sp.]
QLFALYVRVVEIENHSYCNRTCSFCPNAFIDRRSENILMADALFEKLLTDLASIGYSQSLIWSRYHEPMAHVSIFDRVARARKRLPGAYLVLVSNGDYLNRESLKKLEDAGANRLMLDLYLPDGRERDPAAIAEEKEKFFARTGLSLEPIGPYDYRCTGSSIHITLGIPFYTQGNISTRGGLVDVVHLRVYQRTAVCFNPLHSVVVDFNGKGMLCCQVRSDSPLQKDAIIGDLSAPGYSLFDFYRDLAPARAGLLAPGPKEGVCRTCNVSATGPDKLGRHETVYRMAHAIPGFTALMHAAVRRRNRRRKYESS